MRSTRKTNEANKRKVLEDLTKKETKPVVEEVKEEEEDIETYDAEMEGLCEYERIRLLNIREREAMFLELGLTDAKTDILPVSKPGRNKSAPSSRGLQSKKKVKEVLPRRSSARIAGGKVAEIERFVPVIEEPAAERYPSLETLKLEDSLLKSKSSESTELLVRDLTVTTETKERSLTGGSDRDRVRSELCSLTITENQVAKVVPDRIFSVSLHPGSKPVVATGGKEGHLGLWDILATEEEHHGVHLFQPHMRPINCLSWDKTNPSNLVTTSYDGTSRILDCSRGEWLMLYGEQQYLENGGWTSFHSQVCANTFLISQGDTGSVVILDRRVGWTSPVSTCRVTDRGLPRSVSVHPLQTQYFLTGTRQVNSFLFKKWIIILISQGSCSIFDMRSASSGRALMKPACQLLGHSRSLSSCVFSSLTGNQVASLCSDDKLRLYDTSRLLDNILPASQVKLNITAKLLSLLRLTWHPTLPNTLLSGSMNRPRQLEIWSTEAGKISKLAPLRGEALGSSCSIVDIHPQANIIVGGNSSGRLHVFM